MNKFALKVLSTILALLPIAALAEPSGFVKQLPANTPFPFTTPGQHSNMAVDSYGNGQVNIYTALQTPVPVQLNAQLTPIPVTLNSQLTPIPIGNADITTSGTIDMTSTSSVFPSSLGISCDGHAGLSMSITRTAETGGLTLQVSDDGTLWQTAPIYAYSNNTGAPVNETAVGGANAINVAFGSSVSFTSCAGYKYGRAKVSTSGVGASLPIILRTSESAALTTIAGVYPGTGATSLGKSEDVGHTSGDVGVMALGRYVSSPAVSAGTTGDYATMDVGPEGGLYGQSIASSVGGSTISRTASGASNNSTSVKGSAGSLYSVTLCNSNAAIRYLKLYNKATAPSCGSDTPVMTLLGPVTSCMPPISLQVPLAFPLGIGFCMVTGVADSDNTSVGANDLLATIGYK